MGLWRITLKLDPVGRSRLFYDRGRPCVGNYVNKYDKGSDPVSYFKAEVKDMNGACADKPNDSELYLKLRDEEWPYEYTDHDRIIARAIIFDDDGFFTLFALSGTMISAARR